jgi:hypothetical protein
MQAPPFTPHAAAVFPWTQPPSEQQPPGHPTVSPHGVHLLLMQSWSPQREHAPPDPHAVTWSPGTQRLLSLQHEPAAHPPSTHAEEHMPPPETGAHCSPSPHGATHAPPSLPHAPLAVPSRHVPVESQQPLHSAPPSSQVETHEPFALSHADPGAHCDADEQPESTGPVSAGPPESPGSPESPGGLGPCESAIAPSPGGVPESVEALESPLGMGPSASVPSGGAVASTHPTHPPSSARPQPAWLAARPRTKGNATSSVAEAPRNDTMRTILRLSRVPRGGSSVGRPGPVRRCGPVVCTSHLDDRP